MYLARQRYFISLVIIGLFFNCKVVSALEFQPGVGVGVEATDNAKLTEDNKISDQITSVYVGANITENDGALTYDAKASVNRYSYVQDTFVDQRHYFLQANADWEMIRDRFNWTLSDTFSQRTKDALDLNTPDNLQDTNVFTFGADMIFPISARQNVRVIPMFSQYYYEFYDTDNKQYAISADWKYKMYPLTKVGLDLGIRRVDYTEDEAIADRIFTNAAIVIDGRRARSEYTIRLGATNVNSDNVNGVYLDETNFSGSLNFTTAVSSRSTFKALVSTDLTDTSSAIGNPNDVQLSFDVVRNKVINLAYSRVDAALHSNIWAEYRNLTYSSGSDDRIVRSAGATIDYPLTQLLSSGVYIYFNNTTQPTSLQYDDTRYTFGGNLKYRFTPKLHSTIDLKYRTRDSTDPAQNYDELSVFANLVYGFGGVSRLTRAGDY